jgi:hypothetical protein
VLLRKGENFLIAVKIFLDAPISGYTEHSTGEEADNKRGPYMEHMDPTILLQNLTDVAEVFSYLGRRLEAAAHELRTIGTPPDKSLINELMAARQNFADLRAQGCALAESLALSPLPDVDSLASLSEIKALLGKIAHTEEERKTTEQVSQRAVMVLNRVCALRHSGLATFEPLVHCQTRATALRDEITSIVWPQVHPVAEAIAKEDDAFSALLTVVERGDEIDDELCGAFQEVVSLEFGKPLAVAALRGKLVFSEVSPSARVEPNVPEPLYTAGDPVDLSAPAITTEQETGDESAALPIAESVAFVVESDPLTEQAEETSAGIPPTEESLVASSALPDLNGQAVGDAYCPVAVDVPLLDPPFAPPAEHELQKSLPTEAFYRFTAEERSQKIAALLLNGTNGIAKEKPTILRDLVWRLVFEERLSLAFHVAQCLETHYPEFQSRLPSWLLRVVVLGQRLRTPNGEIARTLKEDFGQYHNKVWETGNPEWDVAAELLIIAAALVPALLAPETKAATLLRGLHVGDYLPHLAAYCECVASYSEQGVPLDPSSLKRVVPTPQTEVIGFVRVGKGKKEFNQEAVEALRQELTNRSVVVADELQLLRNGTTSLVPVLGGVGVCQRAVEQVNALFNAEVPFLTDEPLPRPLLNGDLSRIPSLVMNKRGEVEGMNKPSFADSVLRLVAGGAAKGL